MYWHTAGEERLTYLATEEIHAFVDQTLRDHPGTAEDYIVTFGVNSTRYVQIRTLVDDPMRYGRFDADNIYAIKLGFFASDDCAAAYVRIRNREDSAFAEHRVRARIAAEAAAEQDRLAMQRADRRAMYEQESSGLDSSDDELPALVLQARPVRRAEISDDSSDDEPPALAVWPVRRAMPIESDSSDDMPELEIPVHALAQVEHYISDDSSDELPELEIPVHALAQVEHYISDDSSDDDVCDDTNMGEMLRSLAMAKRKLAETNRAMSHQLAMAAEEVKEWERADAAIPEVDSDSGLEAERVQRESDREKMRKVREICEQTERKQAYAMELARQTSQEREALERAEREQELRSRNPVRRFKSRMSARGRRIAKNRANKKRGERQ